MSEKPQDEPSPVSLQYDNFSSQKDPARRWILPAYWLGLVIANTIVGILLFFQTAPDEPLVSRLMESAGPGFGGVLLETFTSTLFAGLSVWIKGKFITDVRFIRFRFAILWGIGHGLLSPRLLFSKDAEPSWVLLMVVLSLHIIYPAIAGFFLCYRSHLRDELKIKPLIEVAPQATPENARD